MADLQSLQEEFPDMTQSVLGDILKSYSNDKKKAAQALRGIDEDVQMEKEKKIKELQSIFPKFQREDIISQLESTNWDVECAIPPLIIKMEAMQAFEQRSQDNQQRKVQEKKQSELQAMKQAAYLLEMFRASIPIETIQQILDENDGDIEETTTQLLSLIAQQEEEKQKKEKEESRMKKEQAQKMRDLKFQALREKFLDLSAQEITAALDANEWDIKKALNFLLKISMEKKRQSLKVAFHDVSDENVESVLRNNNYDTVKAADEITQMRENSKQEKTKEGSPPVSIKVQQPSFLETSLALGQQIEDEIAKSHIAQQKREKEDAEAIFKNDLEHIIATQARHGCSPGVAPPLPKQIDEMLGKGKPVQEKDEEEQQPSNNAEEKSRLEISSSVHVSAPIQGEDSKLQVVLNATPSVVDVGSVVTIKWEVLSGSSTNYDWIGYYSIDQPNRSYITYEWRGNEEHTGTVSFTVKNYGDFEFRYFPTNSSYQHAAISNRVHVGPEFELSATYKKETNKFVGKWAQKSGNSYPSAWVGLYEKSQTNSKQYLAWEYAYGKPNNEILFDSPVKPGEYEMRFFPYSYVDIVRSNCLRVEGEDTLVATPTATGVSVKTHIVSVNPAYETAWIGVYFTSETDNRQWRRYKYISERNQEVEFRGPRTTGEYEVRLFANKTYDLVKKSNVFNIAGSK